MNEIPLHGFEIGNFRSYFGITQFCGPFSKTNVIIGPNDAGKSNLLRYIKTVIPQLNQFRKSFDLHAKVEISDTDKPKEYAEPLQSVALLYRCDDDHIARIFNIDGHQYSHHVAVAKRLLSRYKDAPPDYCWLPINLINDAVPKSFDIDIGRDDLWILERIWNNSTKQTGGTWDRHWIPELLATFRQGSSSSIEMVSIPALRGIPTRLKEYQSEHSYSAGAKTDLIERLDELSRPTHNERHKKQLFEKVENFFRRVLKDSAISIEIPYDKSTINIGAKGRVLPIEAYGTGLMQLLILAMEALLADKAIVCIEEPELHLHPDLQRELMRFVHEETSSQVFVTTHSAHIMDGAPATVLSVEMQDGRSELSTPIGKQGKRNILDKLGYRPSDLLQSNCNIWVEGPSDRIYLRNWIATIDKSLVEGWHFSILFYGGRLLSHLSSEDADESDEFVRILPINRHPAILIDSDKRNPQTRIGKSKLRLVEEVESIGGYAWVTDGREVENYLHEDVRLKALKANYPKAIELIDTTTKYANPLSFKTSKGENKEREFDKVGIARVACKSPLSLDILDLRVRIGELVHYIRKANRLSLS